MKFQLKSIAAAVALAAVAGHASAAIDLPLSSGGSELVFYVTNVAEDGSSSSFAMDLGIKFADFQPATAMASFNSALTGTTAWTQYLSSVGGDLSNSLWGVVGAQRNSISDIKVVTTIRKDEEVGSNQTSAFIRAIPAPQGPLGLAMAEVNNGTFESGAANASYFSAGNDNWYIGYGSDANGRFKFNADNAVGDSATFLYLDASGSLPRQQAYAGQFSFDGSTLSYAVAAVPEPGTYAMMLAGLLLVGGMVRRRRG